MPILSLAHYMIAGRSLSAAGRSFTAAGHSWSPSPLSAARCRPLTVAATCLPRLVNEVTRSTDRCGSLGGAGLSVSETENRRMGVIQEEARRGHANGSERRCSAPETAVAHRGEV